MDRENSKEVWPDCAPRIQAAQTKQCAYYLIYFFSEIYRTPAESLCWRVSSTESLQSLQLPADYEEM